ncbi:MAG: hypothetical protein ACOYL1_04940 [Chlamydiia bacterium]
MEIGHYRLRLPFTGEKSILHLNYQGKTIDLPYIPQVHFPLEMAHLEKTAHQPTAPLPTAFFIADKRDIERARCATTVKIKITHLDFFEGLELIGLVLEQTHAKIRVDANRTLNRDQVQIIAQLIPLERLDFFEEPTKNIEDVLDLGIPLALDESFLDAGWEKRLHYPQVIAAVVKPYRVFYRPIVDLALFLKKRIVLSSTLEDFVPIIKLATHLGLFDEPLGIDVERFKEKIVACPIASAFGENIALRTKTKEVSYQELNSLIKGETNNRDFYFALDSRIEFIVKFFWLLRTGQTIDFPLSCALHPIPFETIPLNTKILLKSSGTTGSPKTVCWSWEQLSLNIEEQYNTYPLFRGNSFKTSLDLSRMGGLTAFLRPLMSGGVFVLDGDAEACFESVVPTQVQKNINLHKPFKAKNLLIGGAKCSEALLEAIKGFEVHPLLIYSSTELGTCLINGSPVGSGIVKKDKKGCLAIQKKGVSSSIDPDEEGFYSTNDLLDYKDGVYAITGRYDRVINSGGEKIHLDALEELLSQHLKRGCFFLFGKEDPVWGEALCIAYDFEEKLEVENIRLFLKEVLLPHQIPKNWVELPKNYPAKPSEGYLLQLLTNVQNF